MKKLLLKFTPLEPYFFGNEKTFSFPNAKDGGQLRNSYLIRSENIPSQTTLFGTLRYLLLPHKKQGFCYGKTELNENGRAVGEESFSIDATKQTFGWIQKISPLFLVHGTEAWVPIPRNHTGGDTYRPFANLEHMEKTSEGEKLFTQEFDAKHYSENVGGFMNVENGQLIFNTKLFSRSLRTGVAKLQYKDAFFKKEFISLKAGWSFAINVELSDEAVLPKSPSIVSMGQNRSAFAVEFQETSYPVQEKLALLIPRGTIYLWGDALTGSQIYDACLLALTETRDYRSFQTKVAEKQPGIVEKGGEVYKLLRAGSVLYPADADKVGALLENQNGNTIGWNTYIEGKDESK